LEDDRTTDAPIKTITEKIDGSLGILYRQDGAYRIATRGSVDGKQAVWATEFFNRRFNVDGLENELTLLFEMIYPENRVVVNYGDREDMVLVGARNRFTGATFEFEDLKILAARFGFNLPRTYEFATIPELIKAAETLPIENEGWVVTFADGSRYKFKGSLYRLAHKMLTSVSFGQVLEAVARGKFEEAIENVPDEFLVHVREYKQTIDDKVTEITARVEDIMRDAPRTNRRDFALWVQNNFNGKIHTAYLYAAFDNRPLAPLVYRHEF
jgi:RNA ligase